MLSSITRWPLAHLASGGAILSFHSITTDALPSDGVAHVSLETFATLIRCARSIGEVVSLCDLISRHSRGCSTAGLVAVTFDDAYAALRTELTEYLKREAVPVSIFVATDAAESGARYWWDRVDDLFERVAPARWRAFETACGLPGAYRRGQPASHGPLRPLRQWLLAAFAGRWPTHLEPALQRLEEEAGVTTRHRSMTFEELADLAAVPGVDIGVHTASHPVLPLISDMELRREIAGSYSLLRDRVPRALPVLAVPFGLYDERTLRAATAAGMQASLTLAGHPIERGTGARALPRLCITRTDTRRTLGVRLLGLPRRLHAWMGESAPPYPALPSATT